MYYKVLTHDMCSSHCPMELKIRYAPNEWIYPQFGTLCCFKTFKDAKSFMEMSNISATKNYAMWECEIGKQFKNSYIVNSYNYIQDFLLLNKLRKNRKKFSHLMHTRKSFPVGTIFTDKIKIVKKVY